MNILNKIDHQDNGGDGAHKMFLLRKAPTFDPPLSPLVHPLLTNHLTSPQDDTAPWHSERQGTVERNYTCIIVGESTKYRGASRPPTRIIASLLKFL